MFFYWICYIVSDTVQICFLCKDGFKIEKKFLLDNGRLQLEQIKQSFSLDTVEMYIGKRLEDLYISIFGDYLVSIYSKTNTGTFILCVHFLWKFNIDSLFCFKTNERFSDFIYFLCNLSACPCLILKHNTCKVVFLIHLR